MEKSDFGLLEGEEILWKNIKQKDLVRESFIEILIGIILIALISIGGNILFYMFFSNTFDALIPLIVFPIGISIIFSKLLIYPGMQKYLEISKNLGLKYKELRYYNEKTLVTNKRIIRKSYDAYKIDYSQNPISDLDSFKLYKDLVYINLTSIGVVYTEFAGEEWQIGFKFNEAEKEFVPLLLLVPSDKYVGLIDVLEKHIPLKRKNHMSNDTIIFYKN
ncbi:MAG: hypothetical protein ACFFAS_13350 [Promethearchaeota archaeon]